MKRNQRHFRKGFTLVEMLGVLAIIAILMSVITVGVLSAITRARTIATLSNLKNLETAVLSYVALSESGGKLPLTKTADATLARIQIADNTGAAANLAAIGEGELPSLHLEIPLISTGLLERHMSWRVGSDGVTSGAIVLGAERSWNRNKGTFTSVKQGTGTQTTGVTTAGFPAWTNYIRTECAPVDQDATPGALDASGMMTNEGVNFLLDGSTDLPTATRVAYVALPGLSLNDAIRLSEEVNGSLNEATATTPVQSKGKFVFAAPEDGADSVTAFYFLANI